MERDRELALLRQLYASCRQGSGGVVLIGGGTASGKTALLHTFAEESVEAGSVFLTATASIAEQGLPFGVIGQLLTSAGLSVEDDRQLGGLLDGRTDVEDSRQPGHVTPQVLNGLSKVLLEVADTGPAVIGVDDLQYCDPESLDCLLHLARRLRTAPMVLIMNEHVGPPQAHPEFHADLLHQAHCHYLQLKPLSLHGTTAMVTAELATRKAEQFAHACHVLSGGNPLLIRALIEDNGAGVQELVPGENFSRAVLNCLYRCARPAQDTAKALAVLDKYASPTVLAQVLKLSPEVIAHAYDELTAAGLLANGMFRHEATRTTLLRNLLPDERTALHSKAALALHNTDIPATVLARHLIAAGRVEEPWGLAVLREAAWQGLEEGETSLAISCLTMAHEASTDENERMSVKNALFGAEWRISPSTAARHLPELTEAALAGRLDRRTTVDLVARLLWYGRIGDIADVLEALEQRDAPEPVAVDAARQWLTYFYPDIVRANDAAASNPGEDGEQPWDIKAPAGDSRTSVQSLILRATALLGTVLSQHPNEDALNWAEMILQSSRLDDSTLLPVTMSLISLVYTNRLDKAVFWCEALLREATAKSAPTWQALLEAIRSTIAFRQGRVASAEQYARSALTLISPKSWGVTIGSPLGAVLQANTAMGRYEEAAAYLRIPVPDAMFQTLDGLRYLHGRGRFHLATGRPHAALSDFQDCRDKMRAWNLDMPTIMPWRIEMAQAYVAVGKQDEAVELLREQLDQIQDTDARTVGMSLRVLASASSPKEAQRLLGDAVAALNEAEDRYELAIALSEYSRVLANAGNDNQARALARRANRLAEDNGIMLPKARKSTPSHPTGREPATVDTDTDRLTNLSDAELRVAALVVNGQTNRQIATELFITTSTVEQHLTRVYRKLNITRRADLQHKLKPYLLAP
ncbi:helix-turn-helix transcriptional regulator [Actinocrispum wychmicini]|nr:LuxR family transcriptional regulator [Actinocrispum wychmicini]